MQAFIKKIQHPAAKTELSDGAQGFEVLKTALTHIGLQIQGGSH